MDFTKGEVYKVVLDTDLNGNTFTYPVIIIGKCLTTNTTYVSLVESNTNIVKAFKKKQISKSKPDQGTPSVIAAAKSVMPVMKSAWAAAKSVASAKPTSANPTSAKHVDFDKLSPWAKALLAEPTKPTLSNKELVDYLEKHLKENTKFSDQVTQTLLYKYEHEVNCEPKQPGIIILNRYGKCIYFKKDDTLDTIIAKIKQFKTTKNKYLLTHKSFIVPKIPLSLPLFLIVFETRNNTYLLK